MEKLPATHDVSPAIQDYLKCCYQLADPTGQGVAMVQVAEALRVTAPSVTNMVKRLEDLRLLRRTPHGRLILTVRGEGIALEVIRHHRLLETFLVDTLGMGWGEAHKEAEILEHYISEHLEQLIDSHLANPRRDPHGEPIPRRDGLLPHRTSATLLEAPCNTPLRIVQLRSQDPTMLRYLEETRLHPGARITLREIAPFNGALAVRIGRETRHISRDVAACIFVLQTTGK
ncbi:MAG: metal-dependent transcriptional regulator [Deltaproteobacteria bacterium]|nr:metal-dependent transcriptional regulator [Deltaproteobacteria bacterium]